MNRRPFAFGWHSKLRKTDEFSSVFRFKRVRRGRHMDIHFAPNGLAIARVGMVVPKKVWARAVDRNRIRRLLREAFRHEQARLLGHDVVIRVKMAGPAPEYGAEWQAFMARWPTPSAQPMNG